MTFAVRQSTPGRPARIVATSADEGIARCAYFVARSTARKGTMTELLEGDETIDAEVSERARPFKAARRPPVARRGQLALFAC